MYSLDQELAFATQKVREQRAVIATLQSDLAAARAEIEDARRLFDGDYDINGWLDNRDNEKRLKKVIAEQATAISLIDYLCGEPNDMQVSGYDVHRNEGAVVDRVKNRMAELARAREALIDAWFESEPSSHYQGQIELILAKAEARYEKEIIQGGL